MKQTYLRATHVMGLPMVHANSSMTGMTKSAIWIDDPTATETDRSILSLIETETAVKCSAALPT